MKWMNAWKNLKLLILFAALLAPFSASAFIFTEFGALNLAYPHITSKADPSIETSLGSSLGLGVSLGFQLSEKLELELGIIYMPRKFSVTTANSPRTSYAMTSTHYPLLVRYWFFPNLSFGFGPYYAASSGNIVLSQGESENTVGYQDLSLKTSDLGFAASARFRTRVTELFSFVLDTRLIFSTRNLDATSTKSFRNQDLQTWIGVAFFL